MSVLISSHLPCFKTFLKDFYKQYYLKFMAKHSIEQDGNNYYVVNTMSKEMKSKHTSMADAQKALADANKPTKAGTANQQLNQPEQ